MDVDIRGQHRHDNLVGIASHFRQLARLESRRSIDDDVAGVLRDAQLERPRGARVLLEGRDDLDLWLRGLALADPAHGGALRVEIHQYRPRPLRGEVTRQVYRDGRLAGPAFGVQDDDALHDDLI